MLFYNWRYDTEYATHPPNHSVHDYYSNIAIMHFSRYSHFPSEAKNCIASECTTITYPFITYVIYYDLFLQIVTLCGRNLTMDRYGWLLIPSHLRLAEWRCTREISGELCVQETLGRQQRILCADSLGTLAQLPFLWLPGSQ